MSAPIITGVEVWQRLTALGARDVKVFQDARYFLPSRQWLGNTFAPFLKGEFWQYQRRYIKSKFDCENFAFEAELEADIERYVMSRAARFAVKAATRSLVANPAIEDAGHAFLYAEVSILPGRELNGVRDGKHATNLVLHPDGSASFFEPQNSFITDAHEALDPSNPRCALDWCWL